MKKWQTILLSAILCVVFVFAAACSDNGKIDELNGATGELNGKLDELNEKISEFNEKTSELNEKINKLDSELKKYQNSIGDGFSDDHKIPYGDLWDHDYYKNGEKEGAASVERDGDVENSPYYKTLDFYNMKSTDTLTILEGYKTIQQGTEWTCGPTSALTVLEWYGKRNGLNELDLYELRHKMGRGATNLRQMIYIFEELNIMLETESADYKWDIYSTYDLGGVSLDETVKTAAPDIAEDMLIENLENGIPTIIGWDDWGGHWTVVIGYDTMGTETTADDVLIVADPYDTTDHCQDGYVVQSFERLYYNWKNTFDPIFSKNVFLTVKPIAA